MQMLCHLFLYEAQLLAFSLFYNIHRHGIISFTRVQTLLTM